MPRGRLAWWTTSQRSRVGEDSGVLARLSGVTRETPSRPRRRASTRSAWALYALVLAIWAFAAPSEAAHAQREGRHDDPDEVSADSARLVALRPAERAVLMPHLDDGPVMLTEFSNAQTALPAVTMMARVHASADAVANVIAHPERYEAFMPALDEVDVRARQGVQVAYSWHWTVAIFTLRGDNVMTVYPSHPTRGHRIEITSTEGDLGRGRFLWRIYPETDNSCVVVFASRIDMRDANYLSQQMASGGNSVNRTINIALSMTMLLATVDEAERRANYTPPHDPNRTLERPNVNINNYAGLLGRGDLIFLQLEGQRLHGVTSLARTGTTEPRIRALMRTPEEFGASLVSGSRSWAIETTDEGTRFGWEIPIPLVSVAGEMQLREVGTTFEVDGVRGSLENARFRFDTLMFPWREAAIIGWSSFDPAETTRLVRRVIGGNVYFSHGLVAAVQVMIIRSLRTRSQRMP